MEYWGLDIGGANTKVAKLEAAEGRIRVKTGTYHFPVWQQFSQLQPFFTELAADFPAEGKAAVVITAELCDVFASKREGIGEVTAAVLQAFPPERVVFLNNRGEFVRPERVGEEALSLAAANWVAGAQMAARVAPDAIYFDIGSTTTDIIPIADGREVPQGRTDPDRLEAGELVYTGALRTPVHHFARQVPLGGEFYRVSPEYFAIAADMHLVLENIGPDEYTWPTPDGRGKTRDLACARLARLVCGDLERFHVDEIIQMARYLYEGQLQLLSEALFQVLSRFNRPLPLLAAGEGAFIGVELGRRLGLPVRNLAGLFGQKISRIFPAWGVGVLLVEEGEGVRLVGNRTRGFAQDGWKFVPAGRPSAPAGRD